MKNSKKQTIFEDLCRRIREEEWRYQEKLPAMEILAQEYNVSRITIVGVMKLLKDAGFVSQKRGSGTFISWQPESVFFPFLNRSGKDAVEVSFALLDPNPLKRFIMQLLADCFMKIHTDVKVRLVELFPASGTDPYLQRISSGDLPCCGEFFWHALYARLNSLLPLEELPHFTDLQNELVPQASYPTVDADGSPHIHAINCCIDLPSCFGINVDWAEQLQVYIPKSGITWPVIFRMLRHAPAGKTAPYACALMKLQGWSGIKFLLELMGQDVLGAGFESFSAACIPKILESDGALSALEHLSELLAYHDQVLLTPKIYEQFVLGQVGLLPFASSWVQFLQSILNNQGRFSYSDMPSLRPGHVYQHFYSGFSLGIFRGGITSQKQLHATWAWMRFLFGSFPQELSSQWMMLAVRKDAVPHIAKVNPELYKISCQALRHSCPQPDFVGMRRVYSDISLPLQRFFERKISSAACQKEMLDVVARRMEMYPKN